MLFEPALPPALKRYGRLRSMEGWEITRYQARPDLCKRTNVASPEVLVAFVAAQDESTFTNPLLGSNPKTYQFNPVWYQGDTQLIEWSTPYTNYNISLWQESQPACKAISGPVIFATTPGSTASQNITQFPWNVQTYSFDINASPVFFFLLVPSAGEISTQSSTSRFFNISAKALSTGSSSTVFEIIGATLTSIPLTSSTSLPFSQSTNILPASSASFSSSSSSPVAVTPPNLHLLRPSAKLGIILGSVLLFGIILALLPFFAFRRRRTRLTSARYSISPQDRYPYSPKFHRSAFAPQIYGEAVELQTWVDVVDLSGRVREMKDGDRVELGHDWRPPAAELGSGGRPLQRAELARRPQGAELGQEWQPRVMELAQIRRPLYELG
ncbi:hypothetical protein N431DRAFT_552344 [Stipitochalara longipes BDJ]|nr:hypothetical protein N431DRAFT_552344 [Stipitochalara longipes BDJ]